MNTDAPILLAAAWVAPMNGALRRDGAIVIANGTIVAVGDDRELRRDYPRAVVEELADAILMPGLVNAHAHLELSDLSCGPPAIANSTFPPLLVRRERDGVRVLGENQSSSLGKDGPHPNPLPDYRERGQERGARQPIDFVGWLLDLIGQTSRWGEALPQRVGRAVKIGVDQCLRFGVTTVGDISKQCMFSRPALRDGPLRVISYGEIQAMAKRRGLLDERMAAATNCADETDRLRIGISPHAPYTVEPEGYRQCVAYARRHQRPLATHLAETTEEAVFLAEQTGAFRHLWEVGVNAWDENVPRFAGGPIRFAREVGLLEYPSLLAHVNYCDDEELAILAGGQASVVYCPRTHAYFGHQPHRWREMLAAGINVAVGTDSCASSPDLNLLDDLRLLHRIAPEMDELELWRMGTARAARAIHQEHVAGTLEAGKRADIVAFAAAGKLPLRSLLESDALPLRVYIDGRLVGPSTALPV